MTRGFYRYNLKPGEHWVSQTERLFAYEIALQHPNVRSALDKIADDLTKNGFLFMQDKQVLNPSFSFEEQIKRNWIPCSKDAIFSIAAQGVLPLYTYEDKKGEGGLVTICPQYETYKLSIRYEKGRPVLRFWWINTIPTKPPFCDYVDPSVEIVSGFGYDPGRCGSLNSLVSCLFPTVNFIDSMLAYATRAENKNTDPTMIVTEQALKPGDMSNANEEVPYNFFVDCDPCEEREEDKYDAQTLEARLGRHQITAEAEAIENQRYRLEVTQELVTASLYNRLKLKPGEAIGNQPLPRPRGDLVNLVKISKETVSEVFKIPQEIFSGSGMGGRVARDTTAAIVAQYRETLRTWARYLEPVVTFIYRSMYEAPDKRHFKALVDKPLRQLMPRLVEGLSQIRVIINFSQGLSTADLEYAVNRGLLDYKIMAQLWLTQNGLPKELLAHEEDILSDATKRQLLLGTAGQSSSKRPREGEEEPKKKNKSQKSEAAADRQKKTDKESTSSSSKKEREQSRKEREQSKK